MTLADTLKNYGGSVAAASRYIGTFASGAAMAVGVLGVTALDPATVERLFKAFQELGTATANALTALSTIVGIILAAYGAWKATRAQQVKSVAKTEGVQIHVDETVAPPAVVAVAHDPKVPDVVPMDGPPRGDKP